jgi:hypothetical protein
MALRWLSRPDYISLYASTHEISNKACLTVREDLHGLHEISLRQYALQRRIDFNVAGCDRCCKGTL